MTSRAFDPAMSAEAAVRSAARLLAHAGVETARIDARLLALHAFGLTSVDLAMGRCAAIGLDRARSLAALTERRIAGEPVARIFGAWEFWGLPFALSPSTLVPRPDTETVVDTCLALVRDRNRAVRVLDLGTGSGCILVALLSELANAHGVGIDRSPGAVTTARGNAEANRVGSRALFSVGDWCAPVRGPFDLVVSNPPYIASALISDLSVEVRDHDPAAALDGGQDGLTAYRAIIASVVRSEILAPGGALVLEVGYDQANVVSRIGTEAGFAEASVACDLAGHARVVTLRPPFAANASS